MSAGKKRGTRSPGGLPCQTRGNERGRWACKATPTRSDRSASGSTTLTVPWVRSRPGCKALSYTSLFQLEERGQFGEGDNHVLGVREQGVGCGVSHRCARLQPFASQSSCFLLSCLVNAWLKLLQSGGSPARSTKMHDEDNRFADNVERSEKAEELLMQLKTRH